MVERAPTPRPAMNLPTIIIGMPLAKVWSIPPTKKIMDPYRIVLRRPIISPIRPTPNEAIRAPISRMATMVPTSAGPGWLNLSLKNGPLIPVSKKIWYQCRNIRYNAGHHTLVIAKQKNTQGHKHAGEISGVHRSANGDPMGVLLLVPYNSGFPTRPLDRAA